MRKWICWFLCLIMVLLCFATVATAATTEEPEEFVTLNTTSTGENWIDIGDYLWKTDSEMSDEEFLLLETRNQKFLQSLETLFTEDSYKAYTKAVSKLKQKKEGAREETLAAKYGLVQTSSVADRVWDIWEGNDLPMVDGESYTEEELDASSQDGYGFRPIMIKFLQDDPSMAKGNLIIILKIRSNWTEGYPTVDAFRELGYNVFILQRRSVPYSDEDSTMDIQRAIRVLRYYGEQEGYGSMDLIGAITFSGADLAMHGLLDNCYGALTPDQEYDSNYISDEIDAINSDLDAAIILYGNHPEPFNTANEHLPIFYFCVGSEDTNGGLEGCTAMYENVKDLVPAELNIIEGAGHGFGAGQEGATKSVPECALWPGLADEFMQSHKGFSDN